MRFNQVYTRRTEMTERYFNEITKYPLVSKEKEAEIIRRCKDGDEKARVELVKANIRFVVSVAKHYQSGGVALDDLISAGNIGLLRAIDKFDPSTGNKFISYAVWWIRAEINKEMWDNCSLIRVPHNVLSKNQKSTRQTGIPVHDLSRLKTKSYDMPIGNSDLPLLDTFASSAFVMPDEGIDVHPIRRCMDRLKPMYREIVMMRHGFDDDRERTFQELAVELPGNYSSESLRQKYKIALKHLRRCILMTNDKDIVDQCKE